MILRPVFSPMTVNDHKNQFLWGWAGDSLSSKNSKQKIGKIEPSFADCNGNICQYGFVVSDYKGKGDYDYELFITDVGSDE